MIKFKTIVLMVVFSFLLIIGVNGASASNLAIQNNTLQVAWGIACSTDTIYVEVDGNYNVEVNAIPTSCFGQTMVVKIIASDTPTAMYLKAIPEDSSHTFSERIYNPMTVSSVKVAFSGWEVPSEWSFPVPPVYVSTETLGVMYRVGWTLTSPTSFCAQITLWTESTTPLPWKVDVLYFRAPFNKELDLSHYTFNAPGYGFTTTAPVDNKFQIVGNTSDTSTVVAGSSRLFRVCNASTPIPEVATSPVVYKVTEGSSRLVTTGGSWRCKYVTVSVTGSYFYVQWAPVNIDITNIYNTALGTAIRVDVPYQATQVSEKLYTISGRLNAGYPNYAVNDSTSRVIDVCWGKK